MFLVLAHARRKALRSCVTEHLTAEWTATQIVQAFLWDTAPRCRLRDRDQIWCEAFRLQA